MQLFKDRSLNVAIVISASWHFLCMLSISPILISGHFRENSTTISFLGSILEKVVAVPEKPLNFDSFSIIQKIERMRDIGLEYVTLMQPQIPSKSAIIQPDKEEFIFSRDRHRSIVLKRYEKSKERPGFRFKDVLITGEAMNRGVLYRPDLFNAGVFPSYFTYDYNVSVRFRISRHGFVKKPECIVSSGDAEIDQMAIRYIRKWQFVPDVEWMDREQEGVVRISFRGQKDR